MHPSRKPRRPPRESHVRAPIHPGEILADELAARALSPDELASAIGVPPDSLHRLLAGQENLTPATAHHLASYFGTSPDFWMSLQSSYVLDLAR
jgi:addiction module HigA family antidote